MFSEKPAILKTHTTLEAEIQTEPERGAWYLEIPAGPEGSYRLAQLDNYAARARTDFPCAPPLIFRLRARVSDSQIPGTWGFGLWNDPFSLSLGLGGGTRRFPALPNAAWFFFASPQNYLSFRDDLSANGFLAQTFRSPTIPTLFLALGAIGFPLLLWHRLACRLRPFFRQLIREDSFTLDVDVTHWHVYTLEWQIDRVIFKIDDQTFETRITPKAPMGFVIWIDNQYAAFHPDGKLAYGTLENPYPASLEIEGFSIQK